MKESSSPDVCARCAKRGKTCCELSGGDEEFCFPLSDAERQNLINHGIDENAFVRVENSPAFVQQLAYLLPHRGVKSVFSTSGQHWRLATTEGRCVFLGANGCSLGRDLRPLYCRLFPLWVSRGQVTWFMAEECLANAECDSTTEMLDILGTDATETRELYAELCLALGLRSSKVLS